MLKSRFSVVALSIATFFALEAATPWIYAGDENDPNQANTAPQPKKRKNENTSDVLTPKKATQPKSVEIYTPEMTHKRRIFSVSPNSKGKTWVIYLIHDFPEDVIKFQKVNLRNRAVSFSEFQNHVGELNQLVQDLKTRGTFYSHHRYIGLVSAGSNLDRTTENRFNEHRNDCNRKTEVSEKRLCIGLRQASREERNVNMTVLLYGVAENQLEAIEPALIKLFGGLEDLGWNSNPGNLTAYREFKAGYWNAATPKISAPIPFPGFSN
jgi:hypothetical protein